MKVWFHELEAWRDFYAFAGAAAATLMGLMFVVVSVGQRALATEEGSRALRGFFTPIVLFFTTVITVAVLMLIPDTLPSVLGVLLAAVALTGFVVMIASGVHATWTHSDLGLDDLTWYVILPYVSYAAIGAASLIVWRAPSLGLHIVAGAVLLLLLVGIRNAWDLVVYQIQQGNRERDPD